MAQKKKKLSVPTTVSRVGDTAATVRTYHPFELTDRRVLLIALGLVLAIAVLFGRTYGFEFIDYDDPYIITQNPHVTAGVTWEGVKWAFTTTDFFYWQPLAWISHMLDCQLFGLNPGPPHIINAILHLFNTLLAFGLLYYVTGCLWRSGFVAAIFALHPLRVESVAWAGERKDVLSGLFFLITLCLWVRYTEKPTPRRYAMVLLTFALALMSKPVVVTLPLLLLFLDFWPLNRWTGWRGAWLLVKEKIPLFVAAAAVSLTTLFGNAEQGALVSTDILPMGLRVANAILSYAKYVVHFVWPSSLGMLYPYTLPTLEELALSSAVLVFLTGASLLYARKYPYLLAGWLWFVVALLPTSGLTQTGSQAMADRFTYLALIGLAVALTWWICDVVKNPHLLSTGALAAIIAMGVLSWIQVGYWQNSVTLYRHTLAVTGNNLRVLHNLGGVYYRQGQLDEAERCYRQAVKIAPKRLDDRLVLAQMLQEEGKSDAAVQEYKEIIRMDDKIAPAWKGLGLAFIQQKKTLEAMVALRRAVKLAPEDSNATALLTGLQTFHGDINPPEDIVEPEKGSKLAEQVPVDMQKSFGEQQAVELGAVLAWIALALLLPVWGTREFGKVESRLAAWSAKPKQVMIALFAFPLLIRLLLIPVLPPPVPIIADEFGYLLVADTMANGRLASPVHPMHEFFESIYILQKTSYTSVYPVAQGMLLAIPKILGMNPWIGVWLSVGAMCAALYWMLLAWLPARWALFGAGLAALRYSIISHWMNSYWGGAVPAIGGALLLGSLGRLRKEPRARYAVLMGVGFAIVFQSRPYESAFLMTATCLILVLWFWKSNQRMVWIRQVALPLAGMVLLTAAFSAYYNYRVTGNPLQFPYQQYQTTHGAPQSFYWQRPVPQPKGIEKYPEILAMYRWQLEQYSVRESWQKLMEAAGDKIRMFWGFFMQPVWTAPLIFLPFVWRDKRVRILFPVLLFVLLGVSLYPFFFPHYVAPVTGIILIAFVQCFRRLRLWQWHGHAVGTFLAMGVVMITVVGVLTPAGGPMAWGEPRSPRSQVESGLAERGGKHLVMVRYGEGHSFHFTYVYNAADIDGSQIVWARDLGDGKNREIVKYYSGRQAWLFLPDAHPPKLEPYQPNQPRNPALSDVMLKK